MPIAFASSLAPTLISGPQTAASYGLGTVGERLGQRDVHKAHGRGLGEADLAAPRRARGSSKYPVTLMAPERYVPGFEVRWLVSVRTGPLRSAVDSVTRTGLIVALMTPAPYC